MNVRWENSWLLFWSAVNRLITNRFQYTEGIQAAPVIHRKNARVCTLDKLTGFSIPILKVVAEHGAHIFKMHEKTERPSVTNADLQGLQRHALPAAMSSCSRVRAALGARLSPVLGRPAKGLRICTWNPCGSLGSAASSQRTREILKYFQTIAAKSDFLCLQETHGRIEHLANIVIVLDRAIWIKFVPSPLITRMLVTFFFLARFDLLGPETTVEQKFDFPGRDHLVRVRHLDCSCTVNTLHYQPKCTLQELRRRQLCGRHTPTAG